MNRDVIYQEEDQIKEILTEVSSQFNFMAPAAADDSEEETNDHTEQVLNFIPSMKVRHKNVWLPVEFYKLENHVFI